jgi:glycosyltransferase involved in cell wall biosynthesis
MRVLLLSQYFFPEVGATQTRMYQFAQTLADLGHDVDVLTEFPNHPVGVIPESYRGRWIEDDRSHAFRIVRVRVFASPRKTFATRLGFYGSYFLMAVFASMRLARRYDVVAATSPPLPVAMAGAVISSTKRAAFVMDVRDLWPAAARALNELSNPTLYKLAESIERRLYRRAARITVTTRRFERYIVERDAGLRAKIQVVPNGTLEDVFTPARGDGGVRERLGLGTKFVAVYAGLHGIAQGLETVLAAAEALKGSGIEFVLVGEGPRKTALEASAAARRLDHVRFVPQVPLEESCYYLNAADAILVPLAADPVFDMFVPSKMFDAMACAVPVILSVSGEAREILEEAQAGVFVPPGDADALARAILALRDDRERGREMGRRGREFVMQHYLRGEQARQFARVLTDAAAEAAVR